MCVLILTAQKSSDRAFAKKCVCGMDQYDHDESDIDANTDPDQLFFY